MTMERQKLNAISTDSIAQIGTDTLVGDKYIDVTSGKEPGHIAPNGEMKFRNQPDLMRTIDLTDFAHQLRIVDGTLADIEQGRNQLGQLILTDTIYMNLRKKFIDLQGAITKAKQATSMAGGVIYTDALYRKMQDPFVQLDPQAGDAAIRSGRGGEGPAGSRRNTSSSVPACRGLRKAIAGVQAADYIASDTMYSDWSRSLSHLIQKVDEVDAMPMFSSSEMYDNLNGAADQMRKTAEGLPGKSEKIPAAEGILGAGKNARSQASRISITSR